MNKDKFFKVLFFYGGKRFLPKRKPAPTFKKLHPFRNLDVVIIRLSINGKICFLHFLKKTNYRLNAVENFFGRCQQVACNNKNS